VAERVLLSQTINQLLREIDSRRGAMVVAIDEGAWTRARAQALASRSALIALDRALVQRSELHAR
jgi:transcriptional regulator GlxA family with amidase domain